MHVPQVASRLGEITSETPVPRALTVGLPWHLYGQTAIKAIKGLSLREAADAARRASVPAPFFLTTGSHLFFRRPFRRRFKTRGL